jgi:DnaK suppressor protein
MTIPKDLNKAEIQALKKQINQEVENLEEQLSINADAADPVILDQTSVGRISRIDAIQQQQLASSTRRQAQQRLTRLTQALKAISENRYGYCQQCDEPIGVKRLQVQPGAAFCLPCQQLTDQAGQ